MVDLLDTTFDLGALGIAPVALPCLDRTFAERVLAELELPADVEQQILAAELVNTGDGISTERVAALDPDVILLSETSVGTFKADPEALKQFGRVVFILENLSWQERTKAIGEAVGRRPQAEKLVAEAQRSIDELGTLVQQSGLAGATVSPMRLDVPGFGVLALIPPSIGSGIIADAGLAQPAAQTGNPPARTPQRRSPTTHCGRPCRRCRPTGWWKHPGWCGR
ncbi:MAG: ABC transporter substrate-binding protein [Pseudonocardiaceae bacterium]